MIRTAYHFDANWKVLLLVACLLPLLMWLGFWQLERADEKRDLQQMLANRTALPVLTVEKLLAHDRDELAFRRVALHGRYDNKRSFLLDNQTSHGAVGYHLLTTFQSDSGVSFLVNRGWIVGNANRSVPPLPSVVGSVELIASVYVSRGDPILLAQDRWGDEWPVVIQSVDLPRMSQQLGRELYPYQLRIEPGFDGALVAKWPAINTRPEKHTGYAVQWFAMAAALVIYWIYSSLSKAHA